MNTLTKSRHLSRRDFFKLAGGLTALAAGAGAIGSARNLLSPIDVAAAQSSTPDLFFAGTDGWMSLPGSPAIPPYFPDNLAPAPFNTYIFGFRNVTGMTTTQIGNQKMKAQHSAPMFWVDQYEKTQRDFKVKLTNLGLQMRPDLTDAHTLHWHGFRDAIPYFDGEPHGSVAVPMGKDFTYVFRPHEPGTYMYHCHVEDVEHVHMGMTGLVFVRPAQDGTNYGGFTKFAYNDGDGSTGFHREYAMLLSEVWAEAHWADSHIQLPEWSDYKVDFALLNGRTYPDTLAPNGSIDPFNPVYDANGDLIPTPGYEHLQYQPISSLIRCNAGERVLLRFANLGFLGVNMTLDGIPMRVIGEDATLRRGRTAADVASGTYRRTGANSSFLTSSISLYPGNSTDAIFTAPAYRGPGPYDTYMLYNRDYRVSNNRAAGGFGGQATEVRVYPAGTLAPQTLPNT